MRWAEHRPLLAATLGAAAAVALALAQPSGAQLQTTTKVSVASSGNFSEVRQTVPIARHPGGGSRVVMSMAPFQLPNLRAGDVLEVSAELAVTTDCLNRERKLQCAGSSYRFNPIVAAQLVLAGSATAAGGEATAPISPRQKISCRQKPPNREHHCMIVFPGADLAVEDDEPLSCLPSSCYVNLVADAHHPKAQANDRLIIGGVKPNGKVKRDKGRINVIRTRGEPPTAPLGTTEQGSGERLKRKLSFGNPPRKAVVYSQPLEDLEAGEQLEVKATAGAGVRRLRRAANLTSRVILAAGPKARQPGAVAEEISGELYGEITEGNGFNCTQLTTPCTITKVGVMEITGDAPTTMYVNLVVGIGRVAGRSPGDNVVRLRGGGGLSVTRYPAEAKG